MMASDTVRIVFVIFWLGKLAIEETIDNTNERLRSANFKERLGHHIR
jgi:hypothetical protein